MSILDSFEELEKSKILDKKDLEKLKKIIQKAFFNLQKDDMGEVYKKTIDNLDGNGSHILDVGDRTCKTAKKILDKYNPTKLVINDITSSELEKNYKKISNEKTKLFIGDATKTKFRENYFDIIIAQFVLNELIGELDETLEEWKRILKEDGKIIISEHFLNPKNKKDKIFLECFGDFHEKNIPLEKCKKAMENIGLKISKEFKNNHCWYIAARRITS